MVDVSQHNLVPEHTVLDEDDVEDRVLRNQVVLAYVYHVLGWPGEEAITRYYSTLSSAGI